MEMSLILDENQQLIFIWKVLHNTCFETAEQQLRNALFVTSDGVHQLRVLIFTARSEHIIFIFHLWEYRCRYGNKHD